MVHPSQGFQMAQQHVHASSGTQHAQDRHRPRRYFRVARVTNHRSVATIGNTGGQFVKSGFVLDAQDDLSGTSSPPPFQQTGPPCSLNNIDGCMSALGGGFSDAQTKVKTDDQRHAGSITHGRHEHHPRVEHRPKRSSTHGRSREGTDQTKRRRRGSPKHGRRRTATREGGEGQSPLRKRCRR